MYTDPTHINVSDPGHVEGNTVFTYLDAFATDDHFARLWSEYANLDELKAHYTRGGLGDMKCKKFLESVLNETLEPIRTRRTELAKDIPYIIEVLRKGCEQARNTAADTLADVRRSMQINYFEDSSFLEEQTARFAAQD